MLSQGGRTMLSIFFPDFTMAKADFSGQRRHGPIPPTPEYAPPSTYLSSHNHISWNKNSLYLTTTISHTKHFQNNNLHIFTIVFHLNHFLHILFLHDLLIHLFFPFHVRSSLGKRAFSVIGPRLWNSLPPDTRNSSSLPIFRSRLKTHLFKLRSLPRLFPISLDCLPGFWFLLLSFYALSNDT